MVRVLAVILAAFMAAVIPGCKEKPVENRVPLDQIEADDSNDYRFIFKDAIHKQEEEANKLKKYDFR
jgi:hypothetical protein